ncbi:variant 2, uroporphyrin-III C-methyltransferase [Lathyrus oleraceus]|uniref:Variant 2, uroporphyrin-III C-methyltransferase n=1 Tax=Pisum sativum TaxID=3888 RepID=A0A9D4VJE2_PEA|nr:variant 2, uroporphyrin-III C-methyltransferase [Pisum sativum]
MNHTMKHCLFHLFLFFYKRSSPHSMYLNLNNNTFLKQIQAALSTLEEALKSGFEDFKRIRTDPDLANARASPEFDPLLKRFDESFINENAINAIKSIFGIFNKK